MKHYEIAAYGMACELAETLGQRDAFDLLNETLDEETTADDGLEELAEALLSGDTMAVDEEEEEIEEEESDL